MKYRKMGFNKVNADAGADADAAGEMLPPIIPLTPWSRHVLVGCQRLLSREQ